MKSPLMQWVESQQLRSDLPNPPIGAQVKVNYRIREGEKERVQGFAGVVIKKHLGQKSLGATFTVRKVTQGFGVERVFPLHSPRIESIEVLRQGKVRRAKLYYLRSLSGKKARLVEQRQAVVD